MKSKKRDREKWAVTANKGSHYLSSDFDFDVRQDLREIQKTNLYKDSILMSVHDSPEHTETTTTPKSSV